MRVLHIATFDSGGAGRSAANLVAGLRDAGCDARMLVRESTAAAAPVATVNFGKETVKTQRRASLVHRKLIAPYRSPVSNTWFSLPLPGVDLSRHPEVAAADILHLHWVAGLLSPGSVRQLQDTGKPVFWTLHDQRPFTGGCHFSAGCEGYRQACDRCPQLGLDRWRIPAAVLAESIRVIDPARLIVVAPSHWMSECARCSAVFSKALIEVVPYGVDGAFKPLPGLRQELGIPETALVLLTGADQANERRKGFHLLDMALRKSFGTQPPPEVHVLAFGASEPPNGMVFPMRWLGRIDSAQRMAQLYSTADAFLLSSTEDNLPNTMLEALCCGTPVIAFGIGGVPDALEHQGNGLVVSEVSAPAYAQTVSQFRSNANLRRSLNREQIAESARKRFGLETQARTYLQLYQAALQRKKSQAAASPLLPPNSVETAKFAVAFANMVRHAARERWRNRWLKLGRRLSLGMAGRKGETEA